MPTGELRHLLAGAIMRLVQPQRRVDQPGLCDQLGLPSAPDDPELSKAEYVESRLAKLPAIPTAVAENFLSMYPVSTGEKASFAIEEILWAERSDVEVPEKHRRMLAHALEDVPLMLHGDHFLQEVSRLWPLELNPFEEFLSGTSPKREIERHVVLNPDDWTVDHFFERLGAFECTDRRFALFVEALAGHRVRPDETEQQRFVQVTNQVLAPIGVELRETGVEGGYPVFTLGSNRGALGRPKNLIFASSVKPDLRFVDAVNNDVEIVSHADKVLIYDHPIPTDGLTWQRLQDWWGDHQNLSPADAKKSLYRRLRSCLPENSPPQRFLFEAYHRTFGQAIPSLPALLPEVWLHYDPVSVQKRGREALFRQRMDFLMLISSHARVVVEVDGSQHYADSEGRADAIKYANTMRADRELRLAGYEVYRFGATELLGNSAETAVGAFFQQLFGRHGLRTMD